MKIISFHNLREKKCSCSETKGWMLWKVLAEQNYYCNRFEEEKLRRPHLQQQKCLQALPSECPQIPPSLVRT